MATLKYQNPDVACLFNIKGVYSINRYWAAGVYHPMFTNAIDIMAFDTGGYDARIDPATGALVSQIRSYKVARRINTSCEDSFADDIRAAVHMSFGYQKRVPGNIAAPYGSEAHNVFTPLLEFFREYNDRFYTETDTVADVAVLHNWPSMAYSINATAVPVTLMEQVLIQHQSPVRHSLRRANGSHRPIRYATIILASQECVSDAQIQTLLDFVRTGGTLIVTGNTANTLTGEYRAFQSIAPRPPAKASAESSISREITALTRATKTLRMYPNTMGAAKKSRRDLPNHRRLAAQRIIHHNPMLR